MTAATPIVSWMTSLGDVTRARLLRLLERHDLTVAELCAVVLLPQSTVSRHLKVLADDGWVTTRREATSRIYRMEPGGLDPAARRLWLLVREQTGGSASAGQDDRRLASVLSRRRSRSQEFFSTAAGQWDKMRDELFGRRFDLQALAGLLDETWTVADLGCGTGQMAEAIAPFVKQVIGVDDSPVMLKFAKQRLGKLKNVELRRGGLGSLPIEDGAVDAAIVTLVLHHIAEPAGVLAEAGRVIRTGGKLLIIDMLRHDRTEFREKMGHVWLGFTPDEITGWLTGAGFASVRIVPLPAPSEAKGPALFAATARRINKT